MSNTWIGLLVRHKRELMKEKLMKEKRYIDTEQNWLQFRTEKNAAVN